MFSGVIPWWGWLLALTCLLGLISPKIIALVFCTGGMFFRCWNFNIYLVANLRDLSNRSGPFFYWSYFLTKKPEFAIVGLITFHFRPRNNLFRLRIRRERGNCVNSGQKRLQSPVLSRQDFYPPEGASV